MAKSPQPGSPELRILEIAAAHVRLRGLRRTTIVAIADEAGMSHANVYRYFPSKQALLEAVTERWLKPLEAGIREISDGPDPAYDKLERIVGAVQSAYREKLETDPDIFSVLAVAFEQGASLARRHRNRLQGELQRTIEEGISSGVFPQADHRRALTLLFDTLHRFLHPAAVKLDADVPRNQIDARFERTLSLVMGALTRGRI